MNTKEYRLLAQSGYEFIQPLWIMCGLLYGLISCQSIAEIIIILLFNKGAIKKN